jgi:hypothetical protein
MPHAFEHAEKVPDCPKTNTPLPKFAPPDDFGLKVAIPTKKQAFSDAYLLTRSHQAFPLIWVLGNLFGK